MRLFTASALALAAALPALPALAEDFHAAAPVVAATVYPQGAELTLRATLALPAGQHRVFLPFRDAGDLSSLPRILASPGVDIGAIGFQRDVASAPQALFTPAQQAAFDAREAARKGLQDAEAALAAASAGLDALTARRDFLAALAPPAEASADQVLALADTLGREMQAVLEQIATTRPSLRPQEKAVAQARDTLAGAEAAFERLAPPRALNDMLSVAVTLDAPQTVTLELTDLVYSAGWGMDYDLDLNRDAGRLDITRNVVVWHDYRAPWTGAALTLSTARPGEAVGPQEVWPDLARIAPNQPPLRAPQGFSGDMMPTPAPMAEPMLVEAETKQAAATLEVDGLSLSYVYPDPVTIAPGEIAELTLDRLSLDAQTAIHASPRHDTTAFVVADLTNTTGEPILPGPANFMRDGHLVGRSQVELIPAGAEATQPFGPIEGLRLATLFKRNQTGDAGIITRSNTRDQEIVFSVENLTGEAQTLTAFFPLPYSEQEDLSVDVAARPAPDATDIDDKRGVSAWEMELAPGEKAEVSLRIRMGWPEDQELQWYP